MVCSLNGHTQGALVRWSILIARDKLDETFSPRNLNNNAASPVDSNVHEPQKQGKE